jgi:hypothetical protein
MKAINFFLLILIGIIVGFFMGQDVHCGKQDLDSSDTTKTVRVDTFIQLDTFYRDRNYYHYDSIKVEIPVYIDTNKTITDYFTFKSVQDSFIGKNYHIKLFDTLHQNSLHARRAEIKVLQVDSIIETTITNYRSANGFYIGLQSDFKSLSPSVMYLKGKSGYGVNYNLQEKKISVEYNYKLF